MRTVPAPGATLPPAFLPAAVGVVGFITLIYPLLLGSAGVLMGGLEHVLLPLAYLYVAVVAWALLAARLALDPATGSGFAVAALGLLLRILVFLTAYLDLLVRRHGLTPDSVPDLYPVADALGTFAYAFGLAMVVLATWQEGRRARSLLSYRRGTVQISWTSSGHSAYAKR